MEQHELKSIILYTTTDCNHRCKHCFISHSGSWDSCDLLRVTRLLKKQCNVALNGAEPLLHPNYLDSYKIAGQEYVYSNGLVFLSDNSKNIMKKMNECGIRKVRLSHHFQSVKELNAVPYSTIEKVTKILQDNGFGVEFNSTVTVNNYSYLSDNCDYAYKMGIKRIKFFPLVDVGNARKIDKSLCLNRTQLNEFYHELLKLRGQYNINELELRISGNLYNIAPKFNCTFGLGQYVITPDYLVHGCTFSVSTIPPIGHMEKDGKIVIDHPIIHDGNRCVLAEYKKNWTS